MSDHTVVGLTRVGIDLGGTKIEAAALSPDGVILARHRVPTPRDDYQATLAAIRAMVDRLEEQTGHTAPVVGVGMPGSLSPTTGLVRNANSVWLNGRPLADDLGRLLERPVRFENDANCFALSEARDGAGRGRRLVFGAILGTGTGGGIVLDGQVWRGGNAIGVSGDITPCRGPGPASTPGPGATAARTAASRRSSPGQG